MFFLISRSRFLSLSFLFLFFFYSLSLSPVIIAALLVSLFNSIFRMFKIHSCKQLFFKTFRNWFDMHIITIPTSFAATVYVLFTFSVQKVSDRRKLSLNLLTVKISPISILLSIFSILLFTIFNIDIPNNMISQVIDNNHILNLTMFHHLSKNLLKEILIFCHCRICICSTHIVSINQGCLNCIILIHMLKTYSFANWRFIVNSLATITITACSHLIEKWTINFVHLCAVDFGQTISHQIQFLQQIRFYIHLYKSKTCKHHFFDADLNMNKQILSINQLGKYFQRRLLFNQLLQQQSQVGIYSMKIVIIISIFLIIQTLNFSQIRKQQTTLYQNIIENYKEVSEIKYNGKGFGTDLQNALAQAIEDSIIFYKFNYYSQAHYISKSMERLKPGKWNVFVFHDVNITRITQVSTGFSYWNDGDTWALWYSVTPLTNNFLHLLIYNGVSDKKYSNVTTSQCKTGDGIDSFKADVIASIVNHSDTVKDIVSSLQKFDQQKWSVISMPVILGGIYPEGYGIIYADETYVSYHQNVTMLKQKYSQIIYA